MSECTDSIPAGDMPPHDRAVKPANGPPVLLRRVMIPEADLGDDEHYTWAAIGPANGGPPQFHWTQSIDEGVAWCREQNEHGRNVYFGVATRQGRNNGKDEPDSLCRVRALFVDIDDVPADTAYKTVLEKLPPPTFVHSTGAHKDHPAYGLQAFFLHEPQDVSTAAGIKLHKGRLRGLQQLCGKDERGKDIGDNAVTTAKQIMRVPGMTNYPKAEKREKGRISGVSSVFLELDTETPNDLSLFPEANAVSSASGGKATEPSWDAPERWRCKGTDAIELTDAQDERYRSDRYESFSEADLWLAGTLLRGGVPPCTVCDTILVLRRDMGDEKGAGYCVRTVNKVLAKGDIADFAKITAAVEACDKTLAAIMEKGVRDEILKLRKGEMFERVERPLRERLERFPTGLYKKAFEDPLKEMLAQKQADRPKFTFDEETKQTFYKGDQLANFTACIVKEVSDDQGRMTFAIEAQRQGETRSFEIEATEFPGMNWVTGRGGAYFCVAAGVGMRDLMREAVQFRSADKGIEKVREYGRTGFEVIDGKRAYLHGGGAITAAGNDSSVRVNLRGTKGPDDRGVAEMNRFYTLPNPATDGGALSLKRFASVARGLTVPLLGLIGRMPFGALPGNVSIVGATGAGKTVIAEAVQSFLCADGVPEGGLQYEWGRTTPVAGQEAMDLARDSLTVIDDITPPGASAGERSAHAQKERLWLHQSGASSGRKRSGSNYAHLAKRGTALFTGEVSGTEGKRSTKARVCYLRAEKITEHGVIDEWRALGGVPAALFAAYLQWILKNDLGPKDIEKRVQELSVIK